MIYLDNAATTKPSSRVRSAVARAMRSEWGNPSSLHDVGQSAGKALDTAREQVCSLLKGASPDSIIFTSGSTESNNIALKCVHGVMVGMTEHKSIFNHPSAIWFAPSSNGVIRAEDVEREIENSRPRWGIEKPRAVCAMMVNNETGAINDIKKISAVARRHDMLMICDLVQAAGSVPINVSELGIDAASISGHKLHATKGIGALYVSPRFMSMMNVRAPLMVGGEQEHSMRPGTQNVFGAIGLGVACQDAAEHLRENMEKAKLLNLTMRSCLTDYNIGAVFNRWSGNWCDKILSVRFDGIDANTLCALLADKGVCVSSGSACNSYQMTPSQVLLRSGLTREEALSTIRISFSKDNTVREVRRAARIIADSVNLLKQC